MSISIDITKGLPNAKKLFAISGRDLGIQQRKRHNLDRLEDKETTIKIEIPENIIFLSSSFFLGMFGDSVRKYRTKEEFLKKYNFITSPELEPNIEDGINDALKNINPLGL